MTKRAEWVECDPHDIGYSWRLDVGQIQIVAKWMGRWLWRSSTGHHPNVSFNSLALAQADAVRWLRATIAEMAAMLPEAE